MENKTKDIYDLLILGAGSAGLAAGIYAGRAKLRTLIIEKQQVGGQAATTAEIANYPGVAHISGPELMDKMLNQSSSFGTEFIKSEIIKVDLTKEVKEVHTTEGLLKGRAVILATGANPKKLGFKGEETFKGRGIAYCATCDGHFFQDLDVFVIGGGYAAAEEAIFLTRFAKKVTIVARKGELSCAKSIVDKVMAHPKIEVKFHTEIIEAYGEQLLKGAVFKNNVTGETFTYEASEEDGTFGIFVFIGYQPTTELFKGQVELDQSGHILTNEAMETHLPGVYAAGDLRPKILRQIVTAIADGAIAATRAEKYIADQKERLGIKEESYPSRQQPAHEAAAQIDKAYTEKQNPQAEKHAEGQPEQETGSLLTAQLREQVLGVFAKLERHMTIVVLTKPSHEKSLELASFAKEMETLSEYIQVKCYEVGTHTEVEEQMHYNQLPVMALFDEKGQYTGVKFSGIPGGHEFNSFILAIYNLAGPGQVVEESSRQRIEAIQTPVTVQVAISLSCHFCPEVVVAAQRIALMSPYVEAEMIDISLFKEFKKKYNVMSVPALIINHSKIAFGPQSMDSILTMIEQQ